MSQRSKRIQAERYERTFTLDRKAAREEDRTVPASLSSEAEVERWFGREILVHEEAAIDLTRVNGNGIKLLWNHDTGSPIGVIEGLHLDSAERKLRGTLRFSRNAKAEEVWGDVREGFLNDVSVGYRVLKWEEQKGSDLVRVTRWQPVEASIVSVPADPGVGLNRSEANHMADEGNGQTGTEGGGEPVALDQYRNQFEAGKRAGIRASKEAERQRIAEIDDIFMNPLVPRDEFYSSLKRTAIAKDYSVDRTRKLVMDALAGELPEDFQPVETEVTGLRRLESVVRGVSSSPDLSRLSDQTQGIGRRGNVQAGADALDKFREIAANAILVRAGIETDAKVVAEVEASGYRKRSLRRLAQDYLALTNVDTRAMDDDRIARDVLTRASGPLTDADFPSILANVANKAMLRGWTGAGTTYQAWCKTGSLPDFKQATLAGLGAYPDLDKIPRAGGPYQHKSMDDIHEVAQLETFGALFGIGRQTIIDDDLNAFTTIPQKMGGAAARKVDQLAYNELITSNGTSTSVTGRVLTQDSTALFNAASHSNYVASGSGGAPSVSTLNTAEAAMMRQKGPLPSANSTDKAYIAVMPAYLIVPPELKATASVLVASQWDPAGTTASVSRRDSPNPWQGRLEVISSPILTLTTGWYLAAGRGADIETVTVFFLNGQSTPYIEQMDNWTSDGVTYKVRIDAHARALDFRGLYFNYGA